MAAVTVPTGSQTTSEIERDWRFAELVVQSWIDPGLTTRYREDPRAVLAEFELRIDTGEQAPALPADPGDELLIEDLDQCSALVVPTGFCNAGSATTEVAHPIEG
jgi:putative thiazole/oxazole-modified microcin (TOMM)-like peptide